MKNKYIQSYIYFLAILSISINLFYIFELFSDFFMYEIKNNYKEVIISALALEISWVVIFIWFLFDPFKRKDILLLTTIPMVLANILNNYTLETIPLLLNILFLTLFISLYFIGYYLLRKHEAKVETKLC